MSWRGQKVNHLRVFEDFRAKNSASYDKPFDKMDETTLANTIIYEQFAHFLLSEYVIPPGNARAGEPVASETAIKYLSGVINSACDNFRAPSPSHGTLHVWHDSGVGQAGGGQDGGPCMTSAAERLAEAGCMHQWHCLAVARRQGRDICMPPSMPRMHVP